MCYKIHFLYLVRPTNALDTSVLGSFDWTQTTEFRIKAIGFYFETWALHLINYALGVNRRTCDFVCSRIIFRTVEIRGFEGERVVMQCNVFNMPRDARIVWRRDQLDGETMAEVINDGLMSRDMSRWKVGQGKQQDSIRLEIMSLDRTYEGLYTCECQYTGSVEPARVQRILRVFAKPSIIHHLSSYNTDSDVGDRVVLECAADGIPTPVIYWQRTGGPSSIIRNYGLTKNGNQIEFDPVQADDAGEYVCFAENSMGQALWRVQLQVRHPPIVRIYPFSPKQKVGCKIRLLCSVLANPPVVEPMIAWSTNHTGLISVGSTRPYIEACCMVARFTPCMTYFCWDFISSLQYGEK
ncbi:unnamed protein product [Dicrocoelium dendriticum]|nr:unnamed protein product [Dicrocoelium dendriticum]